MKQVFGLLLAEFGFGMLLADVYAWVISEKGWWINSGSGFRAESFDILIFWVPGTCVVAILAGVWLYRKRSA
jgi:hypothetical protein